MLNKLNNPHNVFKIINNEYLVRQYFFALIPFLYYIYMGIASHGLGIFIFAFIFAFINFLLYPFAMFVYDTIINTITGGHTFIGIGIYYIFFKFIYTCLKIILIFTFSFLIAPFGIIYLLLKYNN